MPINIHQATITDLETLVPLFDGYRVFYGAASDPMAAEAFLKARFDNKQSVVFIARNDTVALGFVQLYPMFSSFRMAHTYVLNDLFVAPAARGKGLGEALLKAAVEFGRNVGAVRLSLSTAATNKTAQSLYERMGWQRETDFLYYDLPLAEPKPLRG